MRTGRESAVELWWVDGWDEQEGEPLTQAVKLESVPSVREGMRLMKAYCYTAAYNFGEGELVLLNQHGGRVGERLRVERSLSYVEAIMA